MKTIQINDRVRILMDGSCYTLEALVTRERGKNKGQAAWDQLGYYPNLEMACLALLKRHGVHLTASENECLDDVVNRLETLTGQIVKAVTQ